MKKIVRNTIFVLSFFGLFMFVAPKQTKATDVVYPYKTWICCPDGNCHCCYITAPGEEAIYRATLCGIEEESMD